MPGLPSFPSELLRRVLLYVEPLDLVALAAVNRHLRRAVPQCIDQAVAKHHVAQLRLKKGNDYTRTIVQRNNKKVTFSHPVLFEHAVAAIARYYSASLLWGQNWQPAVQDVETEQDASIRQHWVHALRTAVRRRLWPFPSDSSSAPSQTVLNEEKMEKLEGAAEMAGLMRSMDLLDDLRHTFPDAFADDLNLTVLKGFLFGSADSGFCEGLSLIPAGHPILHGTNIANETLLGLACGSRHLPAVEFLLAQGAPVNPAPTNPLTKPPIFYALQDDNLQILLLLLERGADVTCRFGIDAETALHQAAAAGCPEVLKLLLDFGADIEAYDYDSRSPLSVAAAYGSCECVCALLDAGAEVDARNDFGTTALAFACAEGSDVSDRISLLIKRGASVNPPSRDKSSPLIEAARSQNLDAIKTLLKAGADVDWVDRKGETALHYAIQDKTPNGMAVCRLLLDAGADPKIADDHGRTPLHLFPTDITFTKEWEGLLGRFIKRGVDLQAEDSYGETAWQALCASGLKNPRLMRWVVKRKGYDRKVCDTFAMVWDDLFADMRG
ncbi:hypothetical protein HDU96_004563 [Phlyctochytrium bullatum]|nr:hypothetical protein HDU96_004563 [Phlyctochytrium bullatum]